MESVDAVKILEADNYSTKSNMLYIKNNVKNFGSLVFLSPKPERFLKYIKSKKNWNIYITEMNNMNLTIILNYKNMKI